MLAGESHNFDLISPEKQLAKLIIAVVLHFGTHEWWLKDEILAPTSTNHCFTVMSVNFSLPESLAAVRNIWERRELCDVRLVSEEGKVRVIMMIFNIGNDDDMLFDPQ